MPALEINISHLFKLEGHFLPNKENSKIFPPKFSTDFSNQVFATFYTLFKNEGKKFNEARQIFEEQFPTFQSWIDDTDTRNFMRNVMNYIFRVEKELEDDIKIDFDELIFDIRGVTFQVCFKLLDFLKICESPIERKFLIAFIKYSLNKNHGVKLEHPELDECTLSTADPTLKIYPQHLIEGARVDFLISLEGNIIYSLENFGEFGNKKVNTSVIVECQGRDYHYSTIKKINQTNSRTIKLQIVNPVLSYSGSLINYNVNECVQKTYNFLLDRLKVGINNFI